MGMFIRPRMEVVRFDTEDVVATSWSVNALSGNGNWYLIKSGEAAKGFSDWYSLSYHPSSQYTYDTLALVYFNNGDWFDDATSAPGHQNIANDSLAEHTSLIYIWYGSGSGADVRFRTEEQPWSYYLGGHSMPTSN